jgi:hypothetical protein
MSVKQVEQLLLLRKDDPRPALRRLTNKVLAEFCGVYGIKAESKLRKQRMLKDDYVRAIYEFVQNAKDGK